MTPTPPPTEAKMADFERGVRAVVAICDAWAEENFRMAGDTVLTDPFLRGDRSEAAWDKSQELQLYGAGHAFAAHASQNIAKAALALLTPATSTEKTR